jgi:hypothetical protein
MKNWIAIITVFSLTLGAVGCSTCCTPYDYDYPHFGGKYTRADASYGRVGSIFSDPNASATGPSADSNLTPMTEQRSKMLQDDFNKGLEDDRESIDPLNGLPDNPGPETLPVPPNKDGSGPTASRLMKNPPLRSFQNWR